MRIEFGALAPTLFEQLKQTGIIKRDLDLIDLDNKAINRLFVRGMLTSKETKNARKRLMKRIQERLNYS